MDDILRVDDIAPCILSYLTILDIVTLHTTYNNISNHSWRDLILIYPWSTIIPFTQVNDFESKEALHRHTMDTSINNSNTTSTDSNVSHQLQHHRPPQWYTHFVQVARRDKAYVIIDAGSFELKAGFSGEAEPCSVIDTSALLNPEQSKIFSPLTNDPQIWRHVIYTLLQILGVAMNQARICFVVRPFGLLRMNSKTPKPVSTHHLKNIAHVCLNSVGIKAVAFRWAPEVTLHHMGQTKAIVLEVGERISYCVPVSRRWSSGGTGKVTTETKNNTSRTSGRSGRSTTTQLYNSATFTMSGIGSGIGGGYGGEHLTLSMKRTGHTTLNVPATCMGGNDLTLLMQSELLMTQGVSCTIQEARQLKETQCYCRARKSKWMPNKHNSFMLQGETIVMPSSGKKVVLTTERFTVPEALLSPDRVGGNGRSGGSGRRGGGHGGGGGVKRYSAFRSSEEEIKSIVELASMAMAHVRMPQGEDSGLILYTIGGGLSFRDLHRRLEKELKDMGISKCIGLGKWGSWQACSFSGEGVKEDWIVGDVGSPASLKVLHRLKRKICTGV